MTGEAALREQLGATNREGLRAAAEALAGDDLAGAAAAELKGGALPWPAATTLAALAAIGVPPPPGDAAGVARRFLVGEPVAPDVLQAAIAELAATPVPRLPPLPADREALTTALLQRSLVNAVGEVWEALVEAYAEAHAAILFGDGDGAARRLRVAAHDAAEPRDRIAFLAQRLGPLAAPADLGPWADPHPVVAAAAATTVEEGQGLAAEAQERPPAPRAADDTRDAVDAWGPVLRGEAPAEAPPEPAPPAPRPPEAKAVPPRPAPRPAAPKAPARPAATKAGRRPPKAAGKSRRRVVERPLAPVVFALGVTILALWWLAAIAAGTAPFLP